MTELERLRDRSDIAAFVVVMRARVVVDHPSPPDAMDRLRDAIAEYDAATDDYYDECRKRR